MRAQVHALEAKEEKRGARVCLENPATSCASSHLYVTTHTPEVLASTRREHLTLARHERLLRTYV